MWGGLLLQIQTQPQILSDFFSLRLRLAYRDPNCDPFCKTNVRHPSSILHFLEVNHSSFHLTLFFHQAVSIREPLTTFKHKHNRHHGSVQSILHLQRIDRNGKHHRDSISIRKTRISLTLLYLQVRTTSSTSTWSLSATSTPESRPPPVT